MFSGKTTKLLRLYGECSESKLLINHSNDCRYNSNGDVTSHDLKTESSLALDSLNSLLNKDEYFSASRIFIDEAQFFSGLYHAVTTMVDKHGKHVTLAGLNGDYLRKNFGEISELLPMADSYQLLHAKCFACAGPALFTRRKTSCTSVVNVGTSDYIAVCRNHYLNAIPPTTIST